MNALKLNDHSILELESNLLLINLGPRRESGDILSDQVQNIKNNPISIEATHRTRELAIEIKLALIRGDYFHFAELLDLGWQEKKKFSTKVSNPQIDEIYETLKESGVMGGKILGAGGGGHMLLYCRPNQKGNVSRKIQQLNLQEVPFNFENKGLTVWFVR